jgi:hypothetical protein
MTSIEPAPLPMPQEPSSADRNRTAYRATAAVVCAGCGSNAGDDYTFTTSGDVHCRPCADRVSHALASDASSAGAADLAGERRCGCGGVASAGKMVDHVKTIHHLASGFSVGSEQIEMGSETVFTCASCGESFALLNRLRKVRLMVRALQVGMLGAALGLIPVAIIPAPLGWIAGGVFALFIAWLGSRSLWKDMLLRRAHSPLS